MEIQPQEALSELPGRGKIWQVGTLTYTKVGLVVLFGWLLAGDFSLAMRERSVGPVMQLLFKKYDASDLLIGVLFASLPSGLGLLIGPVVGYQSDRLRTRWGRRIPFLLLPTPFIVLSMVGLAFSPHLGQLIHHLLGMHSPGLNPSVLICMGLCWMLFEICCITAGGVFAGLINDVLPQAVVGRFFSFFRAISLIAGMIFNYWMIGKAETSYKWIFLGIGALFGVGFIVMCLKVKEGKYPPPPTLPEGARGFLPAARAYLRDSYKQPYYLCFFAATILSAVCAVPFNTFAVFYAKSIGMSLTEYGHCLTITYAWSLCLSYPLGSLADRFHPLRVIIVALAIYALVMAAGSLLVHDIATFKIALIVHGVVTGCVLTAGASMSQRLLPRSKFCEIASAGGILHSLTSIVLAPTVGLVLDHYQHNYHLTFFITLGLTLLALIAYGTLYRKFVALGGPYHYVAPE